MVVGIDARTFSEYPFVAVSASAPPARPRDRSAGRGRGRGSSPTTSSSPSRRAPSATTSGWSTRWRARRTGSSSPPRRPMTEGRTRVLGGDDLLLEIGARAGNAVMPADANGVIRRMPYEGRRPARVRGRRGRARDPASRSAFEGGEAWIDFHGPPGDTYAVLVLARRARPGAGLGVPRQDRGRGAMAPSLQDVAATSTSGEELMSGPEIQAEAISTILRARSRTRRAGSAGC